VPNSTKNKIRQTHQSLTLSHGQMCSPHNTFLLFRKEFLQIKRNAVNERVHGSHVRQIRDITERTWPGDDEGNQDTSGHPDLYSNTQYISYHLGNHIFISEWKQFPLSNVISCSRRQY